MLEGGNRAVERGPPVSIRAGCGVHPLAGEERRAEPADRVLLQASPTSSGSGPSTA